jgi:hypothetical protein
MHKQYRCKKVDKYFRNILFNSQYYRKMIHKYFLLMFDTQLSVLYVYGYTYTFIYIYMYKFVYMHICIIICMIILTFVSIRIEVFDESIQSINMTSTST